MQNPEKPKSAQGSPDFTLLLARMEKKIVKGDDLSRCLNILSRKDVWARLEEPHQLQWAKLAQMAGTVDTALEILGHVNRVHPECIEAWTERLDLLAILDRREELVQVLGQAQRFIGEGRCRSWLKMTRTGQQDRDDNDVDAALAPFERLQHRQSVIARYMDLFSGREDCFARQWSDKQEGKQGYVPIRRPMEPSDVEDHLSGRKTYGIYLLRSDATVKTAVIDVDIAKKFRNGKVTSEEKRLIVRERDYLLSRIQELGNAHGLNPLVEFSGGKGYHFWFLFEFPIPAGEAKTCLTDITAMLAKDVSCFNLEVFPKQGQLTGKGMGNLVKLPLGVHRLTGRRSYFVGCHDRATDAQLDFLTRLEPISATAVSRQRQDQKEKKLLVHPRIKKWAEDWPELYRLETLCPPLGHIIAASRQGKALSQREEKILFQTIGFLRRGKSLLHHLLMSGPDYNPHLVDFKLSRLRGTPLGCRRIHSLLGFTGDMCGFDVQDEYAHPLLHLGEWKGAGQVKAEKVENLQSALENLKLAVVQVQRFIA
jgi:hypothetical protein